MPIKPENLELYPPRKEWAAIRAEVLEREDHACKFCRAENKSIGFREETGHWVTLNFKEEEALFPGKKFIRIVLTIAHLDHNPRNNGEPGNRPNLAALCQRCHLRHDAAHHQKNAAATRAARKAAA